MHVTLNNQGDVPVPLSCRQAGGWAEVLLPGEDYQVDRAEVTEITIGDDQGFIGELAESAAALVSLFIDWVSFWRTHSAAQHRGVPTVTVAIYNRGERDLLMTFGGNANARPVVPLHATIAAAPGWVILQELKD